MVVKVLTPMSLARQLGSWRGSAGSGAAYRQLAQALRLLILDGQVGLGVRIGGERDLAKALGVSRTMVSAAFELYDRKAIYRAVRGQGA
jgi:DNA-binding GntR family transcriptional regulator